MNILYLDCYSGISGDMFLGALLDAGLNLGDLRCELSKLGLEGYRLKAQRIRRGGILSTKFSVIVDRDKRNKRRTLKDILSLIKNSKLEEGIKDRAPQIFKLLAQAEGDIHGTTLKRLHFHELGDIDSIVDIVGALIGLKILKIDRIYSSPINMGGGSTVTTRGGVLPLPAPATLYLLKGKPMTHSNIKSEVVTPTGAALLANLVDRFDYFPLFSLNRVGYGAGTSDFKEISNTLRVMIGETKESALKDRICVIEANIDDMNPVDYEYLMERLFKEGALDVYLVPIQMKKTRPGILITILAKRDDLDRLSSIIFNESTTIGIRYYEAERKKLKRELSRINTRYGSVRVKLSFGPNGTKRVVPEYEDCKKIADSKDIPLSQVRKEVDKVASRL